MSQSISLTDDEVASLLFLLSSIISDYSAGGFVGRWSGKGHIDNIDRIKRKLNNVVNKEIYNKQYR